MATLAAVSAEEMRVGSSRLQVEWLSNLEPRAGQRWLVENIVPTRGLVAMIGPPGAGKTFLAVDLALHVCSGRDWLGHRTERGLVVYLGAEDADGLRMRLIALREHLPLDKGPPFALIDGALDLLRADDLKKLEAGVRQASEESEFPVSLVIVDTLSRTFGDADENSSDMAAYVRNLDLLKSGFDCTVLLLHHPPKNSPGRSPRGHSSLPAACDTILAVTDRNPRRLIVEKQRNGPSDISISFRLRPIDGSPHATCMIEQVGTGAVSARGRSLGDDENAALRELTALVRTEGAVLTAALPAEAPAEMRTLCVVSLHRWEAVSRSALRAAHRKPDSVRRAFQRAKERLLRSRTIGIWEGWVWLVE